MTARDTKLPGEMGLRGAFLMGCTNVPDVLVRQNAMGKAYTCGYPVPHNGILDVLLLGSAIQMAWIHAGSIIASMQHFKRLVLIGVGVKKRNARREEPFISNAECAIPVTSMGSCPIPTGVGTANIYLAPKPSNVLRTELRDDTIAGSHVTLLDRVAGQNGSRETTRLPFAIVSQR